MLAVFILEFPNSHNFLVFLQLQLPFTFIEVVGNSKIYEMYLNLLKIYYEQCTKKLVCTCSSLIIPLYWREI